MKLSIEIDNLTETELYDLRSEFRDVLSKYQKARGFQHIITVSTLILGNSIIDYNGEETVYKSTYPDLLGG